MSQLDIGAPSATSTPSSDVGLEDKLYRKVTLRIVPVLLLSFIAAYLDRVNIGFAKIDMQGDLGHSDVVYGFGAGIFFLGYFFFEIPSNIILHRVGAKIWMARIMVTWGVISGAMAFVKAEWQFYLVRFLLGVAEAGFFPGVILYLTYWYPSRRRARVTSIFMSAVALAGIVGGPISGVILKHFDGVMQLKGWQWMYLIEAIPSLVFGVLLLILLDNKIADAKWLSDEEKAILSANIKQDMGKKEHKELWSFFKNPRVWKLAMIDFCLVMGLYGVSFWLPSLIHDMGVRDNVTIGLLSSLPWMAGILCMIAGGYNSDRYRERRWHLAVPALIGALGLSAAVIFSQSYYLEFAALIVATMGLTTALPMFWSLPTAFLAGATAAGGIALINSIANIAGFVSPFMVGWLSSVSGSKDHGMLMLAGFLVLGAGLTLTVPKNLVNDEPVGK